MNDRYRQRRLPAGFSFLGEAETLRLQEKMRAAQSMLQAAGFERVMPASVDFPEAFEVFGKPSEYIFRGSDGERLALRNDLTVQVIKGFCNQLEFSSQIRGKKLHYTAPVFPGGSRGEREIWQIGAEVIGLESSTVIPDLIRLSVSLAEKAFGEKLRIALGDVRITREIPGIKGSTERIIRFKNTEAFAGLIHATGVPAAAASAIADGLLRYGEERTSAALEHLRKLNLKPWRAFLAAVETGLHSMKKTAEILAASGIEVMPDPLMLRDFNYYSGAVFEGYSRKLPSPPLRGGSYDSLISGFSELDLPASGFALDASLIF